MKPRRRARPRLKRGELESGSGKALDTCDTRGPRLEAVINFPTTGAGRQFFSFRGARSDAYREYVSDEGRRNGENGPQPAGLRGKSGHTSLSSSTVGPPQSNSPLRLASGANLDAAFPQRKAAHRDARAWRARGELLQPSDSASSGPIFPRNAGRAKVNNSL